MKISITASPYEKNIALYDLAGKKQDMELLREELEDFEKYKILIIDLSGVHHIDTGFINLMNEYKQRFPKTCRKIKLVNPDDKVLEKLIGKRVHETYDIYPCYVPAMKRAEGREHIAMTEV